MSSPLSGFTAVPNPQMLAFMPIQSYLMMYFAGAGWQIGKRKISAIPNEEFNKMSANDLLKGFTADLRETIPTLESSLQDITPLIKVLIEQYGDFIREAIAATGPALETGLRPSFEQAGLIPTVESTKHLPTLEQFLKGLFPSLPAAEARLGPGVPSAGNIPPGTFPNQFIGPSKETSSQRASRLQSEHNAEVQRLALLTRSASPKISTVHQTALQASRTTLLRPAGQTQKIERARLTKLILAEANAFKQAKARLTKFSQSTTALKKIGIEVSPPSLAKIRATASRSMLLATQRLKKTQTLLNGLIARYRWT